MNKNPPAVGPRGGVAGDLENPSVHRAKDPRKQRPAGLSAIGQYGIPERWWRALRTGDDMAGGYSGVSTLIGVLVTSEAPDSVIHALLHDTENAGAAMFHTKSNGRPRPWNEADGMIRRALASKRRWLASEKSKGGDRAEAIAFAASVADAAEANTSGWRGVGGATDEAVLLAVVGIAEHAGRWEFHASVRDVADAAGVGVATAHRSLGRLVAGGWLRRVSKSSGEAATMYRLAVPGGRNWNTLPVSSRTTPSVPLASSPALDVWRWGGGLGKAARRLWAMLAPDEAIPTAVLADMVGTTPRTVRRHLAVLSRYGLARRHGDGWIRGEADPEAVGRELAVAGTGERQRERHRADREGRAEYLRRGRRRRRSWVASDGSQHTFIPLPDGSSVTVTIPAPARASAAIPTPATA